MFNICKKNIVRFVFLFVFLFMFLAPIEARATQFVDIGKISEEGTFDFNTSVGANDMQFGGIEETENFWDLIYSRYRGIIMFVSGIISLFFVGIFIVNITKYGASAANPNARKQVMVTLLWTGAAAAIFGGVTLWIGLFYNIFT